MFLGLIRSRSLSILRPPLLVQMATQDHKGAYNVAGMLYLGPNDTMCSAGWRDWWLWTVQTRQLDFYVSDPDYFSKRTI